MHPDLLDKLETPANMEDVLNEVSKIKSAVTDAVDDGVRSALRTIKNGRHAAEDAIDDAKRVVRRNPMQAMGICFSAGLIAGCILGWAGTRRY